MWREISEYGRKMVSAGLTSSRFGNISTRYGDKILITCTGSMLDEIGPDQLVEIELEGPGAQDALASSEASVHRAIYRDTPARAVIHTHSPHAVALSLLEDLVEPMDAEGRHFLGAMPVVEGAFGSEELARNASAALNSHNACIARGHGVFAAAKSLSEAFAFACMAEHSSQVIFLVKAYRR
jgi:L-fuculose-phosphate aldolase